MTIGIEVVILLVLILVNGVLAMSELAILKDTLEVGELPEEGEYSTFAGFVLHQLGSIPVTGDRFAWDRWSFEVVDMDGRRVDKVLVSPLPGVAED